MTEDRQVLRCPACDTALARVGSGRAIATTESEFPFTRRTDHVSCDACDTVVPIRELRADVPPLGGIPETLHELSAEDDPSRTVPRDS